MRSGIAYLLVLLSITFSCAGFCADNAFENTAVDKAIEVKSTDKMVTVEADNTAISEVIQSLSKQAEQKIIVESTVKGAVKASLKDQPLEKALDVICKSGKLQWRKIYIKENSKLLEQPDSLAATIRLMSGLNLPDIIVSGSSDSKSRLYCTEKKNIDAVQDKLSVGMSLKPVYLVTNDAAVAEKAASDDKEEDSAVDKYMDLAKESMDMFVKMTPEERERALVEGIALTQQMDPQYMSSVMQTMMEIDPERMRSIAAMQTEMLFNMSTEQRRKMLKMNMQFANMITPEQRQMLMEDSKAVVEELAREQGLPQQ